MKRTAFLVDTGPLVALLSSKDTYHEEVVDILKTIRPPLFTTWPVLTESLWLLRRDSVAKSGLFKLFNENLLRTVHLEDYAFQWISRFFKKYDSIEPQLADASLMYLYDEGGYAAILTLDRRDFGIFRTTDKKKPVIIP